VNQRFLESLKRWLCSRDWHWLTYVTLYGGDGPDYATHRVKCRWCGKRGFAYHFDGKKTVELMPSR
jgi:hypothetical protein